MNSQEQLAVLQLAKQMGLDPSSLDSKQYQLLAIRVRGAGQLVKDGARAILSRANVALRLRVVSDEVAAGNAQVCEQNTCGMFRRLADGEPACDGCQCSAKYLRAKWKDSRQKCPKDLWDNRTKASVHA